MGAVEDYMCRHRELARSYIERRTTIRIYAGLREDAPGRAQALMKGAPDIPRGVSPLYADSTTTTKASWLQVPQHSLRLRGGAHIAIPTDSRIHNPHVVARGAFCHLRFTRQRIRLSRHCDSCRVGRHPSSLLYHLAQDLPHRCIVYTSRQCTSTKIPTMPEHQIFKASSSANSRSRATS